MKISVSILSSKIKASDITKKLEYSTYFTLNIYFTTF